MAFNNSKRETKQCLICGKKYLALAKAQKYCSEKCAKQIKLAKFRERYKAKKQGNVDKSKEIL